ncbi:hypothetical protein EJB05_39262 [Eragrostis curvula]|uniref:Dirigent protein n=1 Tax=Eragrostis curvula TaxID=38414 RepID=A0A5J9TWI7_9POAL|nr:hypothetical protein EJB05_39262 [Eragrostis curvula]
MGTKLRNALVAMALAFLTVSALAEEEVNMTLYATQRYGGNDPERNQVVVVRPGEVGGFGTTVISDWIVTENPGHGTTVVARAKGMHFLTSKTDNDNWVTLMIIDFQGTRFKGSTIQVMGFIPVEGQWSIIGGTGQLTLARGVVNHNIYQHVGSARTYQLNFRVFYTPLNATVPTGSNTMILEA